MATAVAPLRPVGDFELSPIKQIELAASRIPDVVSLAQGIPSFDTPDPIKRYVIEKIEDGSCAKYSLSPGLVELRELIADSLLADGMRYDPDGEIVVTCGAIEAVSATLLAFVDAGDEVLLASPTYVSYTAAIRMAGAKPRFFALREDANFDLDPEAIEAAITRRTKAILLCNPNNPTGTVYSQAETARMMEIAERHDLLVITDDVYKDFLYTDEQPGNPAKLTAHRDRVVRICSFSKAYGMTGWRVGFLHAARRRADAILAVHDALVTCAPVASQYGAIAALRQGEEFLESFRTEFRARRSRVIERLDALPRVFDYQTPNASYFAFPRVKDTVPLARDSRALANDILAKAHVALVPGVAFGPTGESHLRFCYARDTADIDRAFDRLTDYFSGRSLRTYSLPAAPTVTPVGGRRRALATWWFDRLARSYLKRTRPRVIAIAGGRGKTVLKRFLTELLARQWRVRSSPLSYNTPIGLALSVLDTTIDTRDIASVASALVRSGAYAFAGEGCELLIVELGVRQRGDVAKLLDLVSPTLAVITPITESDADGPDAVTVLRSEMEALAAAVEGQSGKVFVCRDDPALAELAARTASFGRGDLVSTETGWTVRVNETELAVERDFVGESSRQAIAASVAVGRAMGIAERCLVEFLGGEC